MKRIFILVLGMALWVSACSSETGTGIDVHDAWARPALQGENGAVYFVIENQSSETHEIIGATSDAAEAVEMHESKMNGDVMQMNQLESVSLGPGTEVTFEPGRLHIMLVGLKQELKIGDEIKITLQFQDFEDIQVLVPVTEGATHGEEH
ncbi:MAG TPA: copper chaperone PCu(A)C [Anaerolineales bacterium]|nr:copper chaperone PCu(A)C [Anaerolineales bacterium]